MLEKLDADEGSGDFSTDRAQYLVLTKSKLSLKRQPSLMGFKERRIMEKINLTRQAPDAVLDVPFFSIPPISKSVMRKKNRRTSLQRRCGSQGGFMYEETHMSNSFVNIHCC